MGSLRLVKAWASRSLVCFRFLAAVTFRHGHCSAPSVSMDNPIITLLYFLSFALPGLPSLAFLGPSPRFAPFDLFPLFDHQSQTDPHYNRLLALSTETERGEEGSEQPPSARSTSNHHSLALDSASRHSPSGIPQMSTEARDDDDGRPSPTVEVGLYTPSAAPPPVPNKEGLSHCEIRIFLAIFCHAASSTVRADALTLELPPTRPCIRPFRFPHPAQRIASLSQPSFHTLQAPPSSGGLERGRRSAAHEDLLLAQQHVDRSSAFGDHPRRWLWRSVGDDAAQGPSLSPSQRHSLL